MASEPKRPIEELLEASAKARREAFGTDPKMPNPMRARLHDELARQGEAAPETSGSWLQMFWPRLAVAAALATLLVIGPVMWWRGSDRSAMQVAGRSSTESSPLPEPAAPVDETFAKGPAAVAAASPNVDLEDNNQTILQPQQTPAMVAADTSKNDELLADAPAAAAPPVAATKGLITKEVTEAETKAKIAGAGAAVSGGATARTDQRRQPITADEQKDQSIDGLSAPLAAQALSATPGTQRFARNNAQNFRNTVERRQVANILTTFAVQQEGNEIRLVDSDGSTYTGQLELTEGLKERAAKRSYTTRSEQSKAEPVATRFRATGFNISLRKSLVFEGNYSEVSAEPKRPNETAKSEARTREAARIVGTARVAGEPPVEVDARPVPVEKVDH